MPLFRDDEALATIKELAGRLVALEVRYEERIRHLEAENERGAEEWRTLKERFDSQERASNRLGALETNRERIWRS